MPTHKVRTYICVPCGKATPTSVYPAGRLRLHLCFICGKNLTDDSHKKARYYSYATNAK